MAVIKPTLTLTANTSAATTNAGPLSVALSLAATDLLTVDIVQSQIITPSTGNVAATLLIGGDAAAGGDGNDTPGTHGGFIYLRNTSAASTTNFIFIGTTLQGATAPANNTQGTTALDHADDASFRLMTLKVGEFAYFPWDYMQDIYCTASAASQTLEYWLFDRG